MSKMWRRAAEVVEAPHKTKDFRTFLGISFTFDCLSRPFS